MNLTSSGVAPKTGEKSEFVIALKRKDAASNDGCRVTVQGDEIPVKKGTGVLIPEELLESEASVCIELGVNQ